MIFALGGLAIGLVTSLVGLKKGHEVWGWILLYAFMVAAVFILDIEHPFWTILAGSIAAGVFASATQIALMRAYQRNNPWYDPGEDRSPAAFAAGFFFFAFFSAVIFGFLFGGVAWVLSFI